MGGVPPAAALLEVRPGRNVVEVQRAESEEREDRMMYGRQGRREAEAPFSFLRQPPASTVEIDIHVAAQVPQHRLGASRDLEVWVGGRWSEIPSLMLVIGRGGGWTASPRDGNGVPACSGLT